MRIYDNAGPVLLELMAERNLTPQMLAGAAGMDVSALRRILRGKQKTVSIRNMLGLARALDVSLMELIDRCS